MWRSKVSYITVWRTAFARAELGLKGRRCGPYGSIASDPVPGRRGDGIAVL